MQSTQTCKSIEYSDGDEIGGQFEHAHHFWQFMHVSSRAGLDDGWFGKCFVHQHLGVGKGRKWFLSDSSNAQNCCQQPMVSDITRVGRKVNSGFLAMYGNNAIGHECNLQSLGAKFQFRQKIDILESLCFLFQWPFANHFFLFIVHHFIFKSTRSDMATPKLCAIQKGQYL